MDEAEREHCYAESTQLAQDLNSTGQYLAANPLHPTSTATSVRVRDGKPLVTDGPFAETREQLGGYFLVDAKDLDEAIGIAARIPGARRGTVEIRPVIEIPGLPRDSFQQAVAVIDLAICAMNATTHVNGREGVAGMSGVRVLVGTRKGAFVLTSDGKREQWDISGPHFAGWEIYHLKGSPADPDRLYASQSSGWFGQMIQRSNDGGKTWEPVGNEFKYDGVPGTHQWYDGTQHPWEFKRVWHLEPSLTDPDTVYAGVEDAALFRSADGGRTWQELPGLRGHESGPRWQPGAGGMCLHTIILDPSNPRADLHRDLGRGRVSNRRRRQDLAADQPRPALRVHPRSRMRRSATASTASRCTASRPNVLFMQKHWDVMRSDDAGDSWHEVSGNLPTDFGFAIDVHAHEPDTVYVVPIKSDSEHFPLEGKLRVYRSRTGGNEWEALTEGSAAKRLLRQRAARRHGRRLARLLRRVLRHHRRAGVRIGRCRRQLGPDRPRSSGRAVRRGADAAMIRVVLPAHLRTLARVDGEVQLDVDGPVTQRSVLDALEARYPMLRGTIRDHVTPESPAVLEVLRLRARTSRTSRRMPRCPTRSRRGPSPSWSWGPSPAGSGPS